MADMFMEFDAVPLPRFLALKPIDLREPDIDMPVIDEPAR